ncbi:deaminase [Ancylobacter sp. G4_0304]|uniref:deaminase n=1 Tax=Ancylobacter sp. G4_0304 TaxID=3114289 RepID=UPI0039C5EA6B
MATPLFPVESVIKKFTNLTEQDCFYLGQAFAVRSESDDPKAKHVPLSGVGAVIANRAGEIARSANVLPPKLKAAFQASDHAIDESERYFVIEHAERAAIFKALADGKDLKGATLYATRFPCSDCARAIVWSGIERAVFPKGFAGEVRWLDAQRAALRIMRDSGIKVRYLSLLPVLDE